MLGYLNAEFMFVWVQEVQAFAHIVQPNAMTVFFRIEFTFGVVAVVDFEKNMLGIMRKGDVNPGRIAETDAVFEGVFNQWIEQHWCDKNLPIWVL